MIKSNKVFVIAEIGINHNGDIDIAKQLIDVAKINGCDAVKFQKRDVDLVVPKDKWYVKRDTPFGMINYIDYKRNLEFNKEEYDEIDKYCKEKDIDWFASAWDDNSQVFLDNYNLKYNKIASAMLTNIPLLEHIASLGKLTFISTGMSTWDEVDNAVNIFRGRKCPFVLMHCVGIYPCPSDKLNLNMITEIKRRYDCNVGYSSHSPGTLDTSLAVLLGAKYLEVHITLDRAMYGSDQAASLEPRGLGLTVKNANIVEIMLGSGRRDITDKELKKAKELRYWE